MATFLAASALGSSWAMAADSLRGVGVVLIHGKAGGQGPLQKLAGALKSEGAIVLMPKMSWASGSYRTYEQTVGEVAAAVQRVRGMGARKVVLAGHSMGANISFGYAASGGPVDAIVAMAPGHRPDFIEGMAGDSLGRAQAMVAAGQGSQRAKFMDFNQGRAFPITTTAEAYVSFFDPRGSAGRAASGSGGSASVLWVVGTDDRAAMRDPATRSRGSRIEVGANHQTTPVAGVPYIIDWLQKTL
ncbi:alpha/beta fold hydrolase [Bosea sp. MMO-172]|uniref:alpha/beta fold hydrolase n=1 Tax=Bosea sp. MMO-172 TaxID=3127885 RepID=UPI00301AF4ED